MGSLSRVHINYLDIEELISDSGLPTFGALLEGQSIYETDFSNQGLILMGNEGNGIRKELISKITQAVTIPRIGNAESLNVAVATTIFCSEIARQKLIK
jgi:TrmH family RNA methyltransferase